MSYPTDLDEYEESKLRDEIARREDLRSRGLCDYCGRKPGTVSCKFPERHRPPKPERDDA